MARCALIAFPALSKGFYVESDSKRVLVQAYQRIEEERRLQLQHANEASLLFQLRSISIILIAHLSEQHLLCVILEATNLSIFKTAAYSSNILTVQAASNTLHNRGLCLLLCSVYWKDSI